jgi:hypothetical protein
MIKQSRDEEELTTDISPVIQPQIPLKEKTFYQTKAKLNEQVFIGGSNYEYINI